MANGSMDKALGGYLLALAAEYCRVTGYKASTVSLRAVSDGQFFDAVKRGRQFTLARFDALVGYFSANWPPEPKCPPPPPWPCPPPAPIETAPTNQKPRRKPSRKKAA